MIFNGTQYPLLFWACHTGHTAQVRLSLLIDINSHGNKLPFRIVSVPLLFPLWRCNCSPQGPHIYIYACYSLFFWACCLYLLSSGVLRWQMWSGSRVSSNIRNEALVHVGCSWDQTLDFMFARSLPVNPPLAETLSLTLHASVSKGTGGAQYSKSELCAQSVCLNS